MFTPSDAEIARRDEVRRSIEDCTIQNITIKLPPFDRELSRPGAVALHSVGIEPNQFSGTFAEFRYQFEGEEDLLHLIVTRQDGQPLLPEHGQAVLRFVLPDVPEALIWFKPGEFSQHFYVGHDELLKRDETGSI